MGCDNTPSVQENPLNNSNSMENPNNINSEEEFKDFEEIGSKYKNNYYINIIYNIIKL